MNRRNFFTGLIAAAAACLGVRAAVAKPRLHKFPPGTVLLSQGPVKYQHDFDLEPVYIVDVKCDVEKLRCEIKQILDGHMGEMRREALVALRNDTRRFIKVTRRHTS